jgi:rsbT co-antagonist protein RsbR
VHEPITDERVEIDGRRFARLLEALSLASVGRSDACLELLRPPDGSLEEDACAELETSLAVFVEELSAANNTLTDTLARYETSNRQLHAQLETIELQQAAIRELSTPIIEVWARVLCLPVIGIVDSQRSAEMTEKLLDTIVEKQAQMAIIDITGIDVLDTKTADHFIKMAKAVRLLGSECILTGINPGIAQTLTHIGVDLVGVRTLRSLKDALQAHLQAQARRRQARLPAAADADPLGDDAP